MGAVRERVRRQLEAAEARAAAKAPLTQYVGRPVAFIEACIDPERGTRYELYLEQRAYLERCFEVDAESGRLRYPELVYSAPKKSGKTAIAALIALYVAAVAGGPFAEVYCLANDLEQAQGRVFQAAARIVQATPWLCELATSTKDRITFEHNGAVIQALANDYAGAAGANPSLTVFDELWGYTSERSHRLWDEMVPSPARLISARFTVTYAGFVGESDLLEGLYEQAMAGEVVATDLRTSPGMLTYWTHELRAPWQTEAWRASVQRQLRPTAYQRLIENRFVTSESPYLPEAWWDRAVDPERQAGPGIATRPLVWVGVDASTKRDATALVACGWDPRTRRVLLLEHQVVYPSPEKPLDFEHSIEGTLQSWAAKYTLRTVRYDPYQLVAVAQRLQRLGLPMREATQTLPYLTSIASQLYDLFRDQRIMTYASDEIRTALRHAVLIESSRGSRIGKTNVKHKVDVIVALAMAAHAAATDGEAGHATDFAGLGAAIREANADLWHPDPWSDHARPSYDTQSFWQ